MTAVATPVDDRVAAFAPLIRVPRRPQPVPAKAAAYLVRPGIDTWLAGGLSIVTFAVVAGLWPWLRPSQRIVGVVVAALVALNRLYIGAHWPLDILGGAAPGLLAAIVAWTVARRRPIHASASLRAGSDPT